MAVNSIDFLIDINCTIEGIIADSPDWEEKFNTNNTLADFKEDDIVQCTYQKGFFKVSGIEDQRVVVYPLDLNGDLSRIGPKFLKKVKINKKLAKVLYGDKDR